MTTPDDWASPKASDDETTSLLPKLSAKRHALIRHKFDRRLLPIVCILYVLSYADRGNIGNAKTAGVDKDLGLSSRQWTWVLNSFYICYVLFEWTVVLWKVLPAHIYVSCLCLLWGTAAICAGFVRGMTGLIICPCLLGTFEASFGAGAPYFLSLFYERRELGLRVSILLGMSALSNCFASVFAWIITALTGSSEQWRLLFIIEGAPTVLFAPLVYFLFADSPGAAQFLTKSEQTEAVERFQARDTTAKGKPKWSQVGQGLTDWRNWLHSIIHFSCNYSFASLSNFLPTIINQLGYSSRDAQGLTAPCYFTSFILCIVVAYGSDKYGMRGYIIAAFASVAAIGYLLLALVEDAGARYTGAWLAVCGIFPALCINVTWLLNNNGGDSKRGAGLAILAIFGQCSSFLSSAVFPDSDGPLYTKGCAIGCGFSALIVVASLALHVGLTRENTKRDRIHGVVDPDTLLDVSELGDAHPGFRYVT